MGEQPEAPEIEAALFDATTMADTTRCRALKEVPLFRWEAFDFTKRQVHVSCPKCFALSKHAIEQTKLADVTCSCGFSAAIAYNREALEQYDAFMGILSHPGTEPAETPDPTDDDFRHYFKLATELSLKVERQNEQLQACRTMIQSILDRYEEWRKVGGIDFRMSLAPAAYEDARKAKAALDALEPWPNDAPVPSRCQYNGLEIDYAELDELTELSPEFLAEIEKRTADQFRKYSLGDWNVDKPAEPGGNTYAVDYSRVWLDDRLLHDTPPGE